MIRKHLVYFCIMVTVPSDIDANAPDRRKVCL